MRTNAKLVKLFQADAIGTLLRRDLISSDRELTLRARLAVGSGSANPFSVMI
jgi:hypothetical protein